MALGNPATVEAVKVGVELFRQGMTDEVFNWDNASDNRFLASGQGSLTIDPVSAVRAIEQQDPQLAAQVALAPPPAGPAGARAPQYSQTYVIWRFAAEPELAQQFLVDLISDYRQPFIESRFYMSARRPNVCWAIRPGSGSMIPRSGPATSIPTTGNGRSISVRMRRALRSRTVSNTA